MNPMHAFRPRLEEKMIKKKNRKNDLMALTRMRQLRFEMERARTILETIKKREKLKKEIIEVTDQLVELGSSVLSISEVSKTYPKDLMGT